MTLAVGSGLALFLYPHAVTGALSASSRFVIQRNAIFLPIYTIMLGLLAVLGYLAIAARKVAGEQVSCCDRHHGSWNDRRHTGGGEADMDEQEGAERRVGIASATDRSIHLTLLTRSRGAKLGTNDRKCRATSGHIQPKSLQLTVTPSHARRGCKLLVADEAGQHLRLPHRHGPSINGDPSPPLEAAQSGVHALPGGRSVMGELLLGQVRPDDPVAIAGLAEQCLGDAARQVEEHQV